MEDIELVDQCEDNQQRPASYILRRRMVLNKLQQVVFIDDLPGCDGNVVADPERLHIGHFDREAPFAALEVVQQIFQPIDQVFAAAFDGLSQYFGIGDQKVGRCDRIDKLACIELDLTCSVLINALNVAHRILQPASLQQITLLDEIE